MKKAHKLSTKVALNKIALAIGLSVMSLSLVGCGEEAKAPAETAPVVKPALTEIVSASRSDSLSFNGVVRAAERADLSFRVGGLITELLVNEGDRVIKGQVLARLDSRDAQTALASAKLELSNVEVEYQRAKRFTRRAKRSRKANLMKLPLVTI
ncbi:probable Co/Zn/Cd efflux system membrane fusion protein [Vibrio ponticus]|nr:probable Co/Zn/Cd efflux system membrane fusion protein [Vibrio ponticus]